MKRLSPSSKPHTSKSPSPVAPVVEAAPVIVETPVAIVEAPVAIVEAAPVVEVAPVIVEAPVAAVEVAPVVIDEPVIESAPVVEPASEPRDEGIRIEEALARPEPVASATQTTLDLPDLMEFGPLDDALLDPLATVMDASPAAFARSPVEATVVSASPPAIISFGAPVPPAQFETSIEEALALIDEEPEFETPALSLSEPPPPASVSVSSPLSPLSTNPVLASEPASSVSESAPEPEGEVSIDTDDVLVEAAPSSESPVEAPPVTAPPPRPAPAIMAPSAAPTAISRPSDSNDLGELMFDLEPDLGPLTPAPSVAPVPRLTLPSLPPRSPLSQGISRPPARPSPAAAAPRDSLELDLDAMFTDAQPSSLKPPPILRPPPPPQRTAPPPVPSMQPAVKPEEDLDLFEIIDDDEIEDVKPSSVPPPAPETRSPPPHPTRGS